MPKHNQKLVSVLEQSHELIEKTILPHSQQFSNSLYQFHSKEAEDFQKIQNSLGHVIEDFKNKFEQCEANVQQIETEWEKVKKFSHTGKGFLNAKSQEIKSKNKNLDAVSTGIKETVSKIKPLKLAQLPVDKDRSLLNMFKTLYNVLYRQKQQNFDWKSFRKLALKHEEGQDFIFRLVNVNFKDLKPEQHQKMLKLKNDPEFENTCLNSQYAYDIIDIADWLEYVCVGHQFAQEKKSAEKEYQKIRKDMSKKSGGSLEMSKKFWKEALEEIDKFQNNLINLSAQIRTLKLGAEGSIESIKEAGEWRNQQIKKMNEILP